MPAVSASAPGKIILCGEHAVVYGRPAIAVPVTQVTAKAIASPNPRLETGSVHITAPQIDLNSPLASLPLDDAIAKAVTDTLAALGVEHAPAFDLRLTSTIPLAAGLGSGAAVSVAVIRAVAAFVGAKLPDERVSALAYEVEKIHHGTPSGIDNTVVTYSRPVYFRRGQPIETLRVGGVFEFLIADTGIPSPTGVTVAGVRQGWQADPDRYETLFDRVGALVDGARAAVENGDAPALGALMDQNQGLLEQMGVSSPELENLIESARAAGALGAKLSGGGGGGNMIALVDNTSSEAVEKALRTAGARSIIKTRLE